MRCFDNAKQQDRVYHKRSGLDTEQFSPKTFQNFIKNAINVPIIKKKPLENTKPDGYNRTTGMYRKAERCEDIFPKNTGKC
jgi:hypothetical protein